MVSWWPGDGDATDIVGTNDGALHNGASFAPGMVGQGFSFDGVDDFLLVSPSANLNITGDVTVDLWTQRSVFGSEIGPETLISKGAGYIPQDEPSVYIYKFNNDELRFTFERSNGTNVDLNGPFITDSDFHHIAYVRTGNTHKTYVDGFIVNSASFTGSPGDTTGLPLSIGAQLHGGANVYTSFFGGIIDEVEIFNRALSDVEIQAIYNAGSAGKCKFIEIEIDIKPGSDPNSINLCSHGSVPVAILGTDDYDVLDAVTGVDPDTITLADANVRTVGKGNKLMCHEDDVNSDGLWDLVCQIPTVDLAMELGTTDTTADLNAQAYDGTSVMGSDAIRIVKDCN